ncbi:MAG: ricin-type beta-trefoil lectin domain protein, partial [Lewinella sp.]
IMDYSLGQTIEARIFVDNKRVYVTLNNTSVSGSRGQYSYNYAVPYNTGYFKAGCYTQSSIWKEKNGTGQNESPSAYAEVRFSRLILGSDSGGPTCTASVPGGRTVRNISSSSARLDWNAVANIDHYKCRYRKVGTSSWTTSGSIRGTSQWDISGLSANTQYQWQVRSKCTNSASSYTNGPNFTTSGSSGGGNPIVTMRKRNATGYAIDGNGGGSNNQNVHLWSYNPNNVNQQWIEIPRGNNFYSYQKVGTNYCLDGGNGGARNQNLKLWSCNSSNQNQQWKKISVGGGAHRLYKRNATAYNINGGNGGSNGRNVNIYDNTTSQNVHWVFTTLGSSNRAAETDDTDTDNEGAGTEHIGFAEVGHLSFWPNPSQDVLSVLVPANGSSEVTQVTISDLLGRQVFQRTGLRAGDRFDINQQLPKGTYLMRWVGEDGVLLQTDKIVRQ